MTPAWRKSAMLGGSLAILSLVGFACLPGSGPPLLEDDEAGAGGIGLNDDASIRPRDADLGDPFAIDGLTPSHGPFTGGSHARIAGRGFSSKLRVFLGGAEVAPSSLLASDPTRAAIVTPPGPPGFVDVRIRDEGSAEERILKNGFFYDAFVVEPDSGATSGGTRIALTGAGTKWAAGTKVSVGGNACGEVDVASPTRIECVTPPGTPGAKDVIVTTLGGESLQARDAFTYSDSSDGYRGGLGGGTFTGRVKVLAFDGYTGVPLGGAFAVAGGSIATAKVKKTNSAGVTEIDGLPGNKVTVTVAADCHQPITFVDVPVDTVTVYLPPVLDIACIEGDPQIPSGSGGRYGGVIEGQLIFPGSGEFKRVGWTTVPAPTKPTERRAAYAFEASSSPAPIFELPPANQAITPDTLGTSGYGYSLLVYPGNATVYVVAGLEDRSESPPKFVPYAMGVTRGVSVPAQTKVSGVDIMMDVLFDHQVTIAAQAPGPGPRGPDRLQGQVAVTLGASGYAILPRGSRIVPLPAPQHIPFVGVPSLDHALTGEQYVIGAMAATGTGLLLPASVVSRVFTTNANTPVGLGGFLGVPVLGQPSSGVWGGTHVAFTGAEGPVDLSVTRVVSGAGLLEWTIAAPGGVKSFDVPDLTKLPATKNVALVRGAISTTVSVARVEGFQYGLLRYGNLSPGSWTAFASDSLGGVY